MKPDEAIKTTDLPVQPSPKPARSSTEEVDGKAPPSRGAGAAAVVVLILLMLLPLLYVFSIGPVIWLNSREYINVQPDSAIATFYAPLEYAHNHWPTVAKPLDWYVELWSKPPEAFPAPVPTAPPTYSAAPIVPPSVGQGVPTTGSRPPATAVPTTVAPIAIEEGADE